MQDDDFLDAAHDDDGLSPIERVERLLLLLPPEHALRPELTTLRAGLGEQEEMIGEARETIEKMEQVIRKVTAPANRIGTFLESASRELARIVASGTEYYCNIDPRIPPGRLKKGVRVLLNEAYVIVGELGYDAGGPVAKVTEVLGADRLRIGAEHAMQSTVIERGAPLLTATIKSGDEVRVDAHYRVAIELLAKPQAREHYLDEVPELPWEKVGGQEEAITAIKDAIELPLLHTELFAKFKHATPKGFLLYGPPGCGKTLIGKATAYNLTTKLGEQSGQPMREYFMHIKGPEILNMWVGESERMVREIFATAREKRKEGYLPFLFIDEAESILGTRRASRYASVLSTLVPMFCTEMDGISSLNEVVIILASNRADLIDPAILRPGRIDRKIKVNRPTRAGAREIYQIYLTPDLPYDPELRRAHGDDTAAVIEKLVARVIEHQFSPREENKFLEVTLRSGRKETLTRGDLISGAVIASIVERAKSTAIKRAISSPAEEGLCESDLLLACDAEYAENELFPPSDLTEDWLKLIDYDAENVVKVSPIRPAARDRRAPSGII